MTLFLFKFGSLKPNITLPVIICVQPPQPPRWFDSGWWDATKFQKACPQARPLNIWIPQEVPQNDTDEDCLYMNIALPNVCPTFYYLIFPHSYGYNTSVAALYSGNNESESAVACQLLLPNFGHVRRRAARVGRRAYVAPCRSRAIQHDDRHRQLPSQRTRLPES